MACGMGLECIIVVLVDLVGYRKLLLPARVTRFLGISCQEVLLVKEGICGRARFMLPIDCMSFC